MEERKLPSTATPAPSLPLNSLHKYNQPVNNHLLASYHWGFLTFLEISLPKFSDRQYKHKASWKLRRRLLSTIEKSRCVMCHNKRVVSSQGARSAKVNMACSVTKIHPSRWNFSIQKSCSANFKRQGKEEDFTHIQYLSIYVPSSFCSCSDLAIMTRRSASDDAGEAALFFSLLLCVLVHSNFFVSSCHALGCPPTRCSDVGPEIRFPFRLRGEPERCGYPGFELTCDANNDTVIHLPSSLNLSIFDISYYDYEGVLSIINPYDCREELFLHLNLSASPFSGNDYTFLDCDTNDRTSVYSEIPCLSSMGHHVFLVSSYSDMTDFGESTCRKTMTVSIPSYGDQYDYTQSCSTHVTCLDLYWVLDGCQGCGGTCRYKNNSTDQIECFYPPSQYTNSYPYDNYSPDHNKGKAKPISLSLSKLKLQNYAYFSWKEIYCLILIDPS